MTNIPYKHFDAYKDSPYCFNDLVHEIYPRVSGSTGKNIGPKKEPKYKRHLRVILVNLELCRRRGSQVGLSIERGHDNFKRGTHYHCQGFTHTYMNNSLDALVDAGFIEQDLGYKVLVAKRGIPTTIRSTEKLIGMFEKYRTSEARITSERPSVVLKDKNKRLLPVPDTPQARKYQEEIELYNSLLKQHKIEVVGLDLSDDKYYRVFSNGSLIQHGRLYGHWCQRLRSKDRQLIRIDGGPVTEYDYSALFPRMLYAKNGQVPDGDPYAVSGLAERLGIEPWEARMIGKSALTGAVLNGNSKRGAARVVVDHFNKGNGKGDLPFEVSHSLAIKVIDAMIEKHHEIKEYFFTGVFFGLSFQESEMVMDMLMGFVEKDIPCLAVHDSFVVRLDHGEELREAMEVYFEKHIGSFPKIDRKY